MRILLALLSPLCFAAIVPDVRESLAKEDFAGAERLIADYRKQLGVTPEMLEAQSWLGRGALAKQRYDAAIKYAAETRTLVLGSLTKTKMDSEKHLPIALGATIEVHAQATAAKGNRAAALDFLRDELNTWRTTSMRARIQKNIHLLSLEGKTPPPLDSKVWLGSKPPTLPSLKGKPALLFFWAHWCGDCKQQAPILAELQKRYGPQGLVLVAPTRYYGYVAAGEDATPDKEKPYIDEMRKSFYGSLQMWVPLSNENFNVYGVSTTPTLMLLDRNGVVRMYHPGRMTMEELVPKIEAILK